MSVDPFIHYANVVIGPSGSIVLAVPEAQLDETMSIEVHLRLDMSMEIFQGLNHVGHVQSIPQVPMQALATTRQVTLIEVDATGPVRIHRNVQVRSQA